jgi:calpain-15
VQLRNPWKEGEWNGRFSDSSDDWTPQLKKDLGWSDANDGIFWMTFEDMIKALD